MGGVVVGGGELGGEAISRLELVLHHQRVLNRLHPSVPRQSVPPVVKYPDANSEKRRMRRHAKPPVPPLLIPPVQTTREFAHGASGTPGEWGRTLAALGALAAEALLSFLCTALTNFSFFFSSAAAVAQRQPTI